MNEIVYSRLCYLVSNPEEAVLRLQYIAADRDDYKELLKHFLTLKSNINSLVSHDWLPDYIDAQLNGNEYLIEKLSAAIERDLARNVKAKEETNAL